MTMSAPVDINLRTSSVGDDWSEDTRRSGGGYICSGVVVSVIEGSGSPGTGCADIKSENTECIWVANSLYQ